VVGHNLEQVTGEVVLGGGVVRGGLCRGELRMSKIKEFEEEQAEKRGLVLRYASETGCTVTVFLYNPEVVFKDPADGTRPFVDVFKRPIEKGLKLLEDWER